MTTQTIAPGDETKPSRRNRGANDPPPAGRLWTVTDIAAYFHVGESTAYQIVAGVDFPRAVSPPGTKNVKRYFAAEVMAYAARHRERRGEA